MNLIDKILAGEATNLERAEFEKWLSESEQNRVQYEKARVIWKKVENAYDIARFDEIAAKTKIRLKIEQRKRSRRKRVSLYWSAVAASLLLILGVELFINRDGHREEIVTYTTQNFIREIVLTDSSHIWLNENTILQAPSLFSKKQRKVTLKGEAYFEIKRDEKHPFLILTGNTVTEVLGTTFNISMDTLCGDVSVVVNSGKVAFYQSDQSSAKAVLNPNEMGRYQKQAGQIEVSSNLNSNYLSWKTGLLTFSDTPLDEVCNVLSRYYKRNVKVDGVISNRSITGSFRNEKLEDILKTIDLTLDVQTITVEDEILIHK